jgi:hypothetical protein
LPDNPVGCDLAPCFAIATAHHDGEVTLFGGKICEGAESAGMAGIAYRKRGYAARCGQFTAMLDGHMHRWNTDTAVAVNNIAT